MTWTDSQRLDLIGLLDDAGQDALRQDHAAAYQALVDAQAAYLASTDFIHDDAIADLDTALEWLLRSQGVPV